MRPARREWSLPELSPLPSVLWRVAATRQLDQEGVTSLLAGTEIDHDPLLLSDMGRAVELIAEAIASGDRIAIYGDYDADGVTACAVMVRALRQAATDPLAYIPRRESEGYGLNSEALADLGRQGARLVVSVDCGTTAVEAIRSRPEGMRLVVTDHHLPLRDQLSGEVELPEADALVNPQRPQDQYPFKGLAGVGVAYKLVEALEAQGLVPRGTARAQLPLVALGTVADMMPLAGENRWLVRQGLLAWSEHAPPGLKFLASGRGDQLVPTSSDLAFGLGPRINAAGRMEDAWLALSCCLETDPTSARELCQRLEELNQARKSSLAEALRVARARVVELPEELPALVIGDPSFLPGVVGLVAGRLAEEFGRPAFIFSQTGDEWRGSARGVEGLDVVAVLRQASPELLRYGGHRGAGGFSLSPGPARAQTFAAAVGSAVVEQLGPRTPARLFRVDAQIHLGECTEEVAEELGQLAPFGMGNPAVLLCVADCTVLSTESFGKAGDHLKVRLQDEAGVGEAVAFNRPQLRRHLPPGRRIDALFELEVDRWRGRAQTRLMLRDLRPAQGHVSSG